MNGLKESLCEALRIFGCDPDLFSFDDQSTIAMAFNDVGDVFLDPDENGLTWLWGSLPEAEMNTLGGAAHDLLGEISAPLDYMAAGALTLRVDNGRMRVGGLLRRECVVDPRLLAAAVEDFYLRLGRLQDLLKIF